MHSLRADGTDGDGVVVEGGGAVTPIGDIAGIRGTVVVVVSERDSSSFEDSESDPWTTQNCTPVRCVMPFYPAHHSEHNDPRGCMPPT